MGAVAVFTSLLILSFGLFMLLSGLFTAYFGAGKSRRIGLGLTIVGLVVLFVFASITWHVPPLNNVSAWTTADAAEGVAAVVAAAIGAVVALGLFLVSIMKA